MVWGVLGFYHKLNQHMAYAILIVNALIEKLNLDWLMLKHMTMLLKFDGCLI